MSSKESKDQLHTDAQDLKKFGYTQELLRDMGGFSNFAISFSIISIITGGIQLYGYGLQHGGPLQMSLGWLVVSFFTLTVGMAMAELASAYPTAGALYHWSYFLGGRTFGWFTACFNMLGQFAILAGVDYGMALYVVGLLELPATQINIFGIYGTVLFTHALFNHFGIRVVTWLNDFSAWYHIAVVGILIGMLAWVGFAQPVSFLMTFHSTDGFPPTYSFLVGLLLAGWTLTGYDASAHVTEETVDPRRRAPWGIVMAIVVSAVAGLCMLSAITLAIPDLAQAAAFGDTAFIEILKLRLGSLAMIPMSLAAGAMWLCGLAVMTSASRMLYAFSRDGGLPFSPTWARISPKHRTPSNAIWALAFFAVLMAMSVGLYSAVLSIATISLAISYGLPILARLIVWQRTGTTTRGPWHLGKWSRPVAIIALGWIVFIAVVFVLPPNTQAAWTLFISCTILLSLWLFLVRARFAGPTYRMTKEGVAV